MSSVWQRARAVFEAAAELPEPERAAFVAAQCGGDAALEQEVRSLLAADAAAAAAPVARFLDEGASVPSFASDALVGQRIGAFRLVRLLGSGGMGAVYEAEQDQPRRTVALKVLALGLRSPAAIRRFRWEAEVLAKLRHPGIAQVHEVGVHGEPGLETPWFAMELVAGAQDLVAFADEQRLGTRQRLALFLQACDAVHHGHLQGVVHRDLKPQNVLVDRDGRVKVIDFGIARVADAGAEDAPARTMTGLVLGTLTAMAPEQLAGGDVDLRADVYALGVLLFELLAGRLPHDVAGLPPLAAAKVLLEREPARLKSVRPDLDRDLDAVVAKALAKDRDARYASAQALADDVRAFLDSLPVRARPPSTGYHVKMFVRRHRGGVAAAAAIVLALAGGLVAVVVEKARVERERELAQRTWQFSRGVLVEADALKARGPEYTVREALDEARQRVDADAWSDPVVEAEIRKLIGDTYSGLTMAEQAEPQLVRAVALLDAELGPEDRRTVEARLGLAILRHEQDRAEDAEKELSSLREIATRRFGADDRVTLDVGHELALCWRKLGRHADAERQYRDVAAARSRVLGSGHEETVATLHNLGVLLLVENRPAEARDVLADALARARAGGGGDDPSTWQIADSLAEAWRELGDAARAAALHREAMAACERLLGPAHTVTLGCAYHLLKALAALGDGEQMRAAAADLLARCEAKFGPEDSRTLDIRRELATAALLAGDAPAAVAEFAAVHAALSRRFGETTAHPQVVNAAQNLANAQIEAGEHAAALRTLDATGALAPCADPPTPAWFAPRADLLRGRALAAGGRAADAEPLLRTARDALAKVLPDGHRLRRQAAESLAAVCEAGGKAEEAAALRREYEPVR